MLLDMIWEDGRGCATRYVSFRPLPSGMLACIMILIIHYSAWLDYLVTHTLFGTHVP